MYFLYFISVIILFIIILGSLQNLIPNSYLLFFGDIDNFIDISDLVILFLIITLIGWFIQIVSKQNKYTNVLLLSKREFLIFTTTSISISYFLKNQIYQYSSYVDTIFFIFFIGIFIILPQIINFLAVFRLNQLLKVINEFRKTESLFFFLNIIVVIIIFFLIGYLTFRHRIYENKVRSLLYITNVDPSVTTVAERFTLEGYNFGWGTNNKYALMSPFGKVTTSLWTDNKIEVVIPLHWKEGRIALTIMKPFEDSRNRIIKSNTVYLTVRSRFDYYPEDKDPIWIKFIKRLKKLQL